MSELLLDVPVDVRSAATERMAAACLEGSRSCGSGLRIQEALALKEGDLDHRRESLLVRRGKGGRRREAGMDAWEWEQLQPWLTRGASSRSVRCCASSTGRRADGTGRRLRRAPSYLQGIDSSEIIETVHARRAPIMPVSASLRLRSTVKAAAARAQSGHLPTHHLATT